MEHTEKENSFGVKLKRARINAGKTQLELAKESGIDRATISLIENGHENPRTDTVLKLAKVLNVSPSILWQTECEEEENTINRDSSLIYESLEKNELHPGLKELLSDERSRLMLGINSEEEVMLKSIRTRSNSPLGKDFFIDVLISYRKHN